MVEKDKFLVVISVLEGKILSIKCAFECNIDETDRDRSVLVLTGPEK